MRIIYNNLIPFPGYIAINLFGVLFVRNEYKGKITPRIINHESIHTAQIKELLWVFFYIWYLVEFIVKLILCFNWNRAYRSVSFEQEAYAFEHNESYLSVRTRYYWLNYVFKLTGK